MIDKRVIKNIYRQYPKRVKSISQLNTEMLFDTVGKRHAISIDGDKLIIGSLADNPIFSCIKMTHIHAIVPFEEWTAIVLSTSILFLHRKTTDVQINLRPQSTSLLSRLKSLFKK